MLEKVEMINASGVIEYVEVRGEHQIQRVKDLFGEYARSLGFSLRFQGFEKELEQLPGEYAPPEGCLFLAMDGGNAIGCVGLKPSGTEAQPLSGSEAQPITGSSSERFCEMKRLYVQPQHRRSGVGKKLSEIVISKAAEIGYTRMRLDTIITMNDAVEPYRSLGFREIDPYRYSPIEGAVFMELKLIG